MDISFLWVKMAFMENNSGKGFCVFIGLQLFYQFHYADVVYYTMLPGLEITENLVANRVCALSWYFREGANKSMLIFFLTSVIISGHAPLLQQTTIVVMFFAFLDDTFLTQYCYQMLLIPPNNLTKKCRYMLHCAYLSFFLIIRLGIFWIFIKKIVLCWWEPFWFIDGFPKAKNIDQYYS